MDRRIVETGKSLLQIIIFAAAIFFIGRLIQQNWAELAAYNIVVDWPILFLSSVLLLVHLLLFSYHWRQVFLLTDTRISTTALLKPMYAYQLSSYIPGIVWQFYSLTHYGGKEGLSKKKITGSILLHILLHLTGAILVGFIGVLTIYVLPIPLIAASILFVLGSLLLLHPRIFLPLGNRALTLIGKEQVTIDFTYREILNILPISFLVWITGGAGFYALTASLTAPASAPYLIGAYAASWALGFLILIVPGGLGIREGALILLLQQVFPETTALIIALLARPWRIAGEIIMFGGGSLLTGQISTSETSADS